MTEEEAREYNRLVDHYNRLAHENERLTAELNEGLQNCVILTDNIAHVGSMATKKVSYVSGEVSQAEDSVEKLYDLLADVTEHYFLFKNLSEASKMMTKYSDEYYTRFGLYHELRRISLGYVVGLDAHVVSSETMRKKVEKVYLANTDYWLAYASMSVMLWASDEKEAALRAMNKSMTMDGYKSCVFYMLINLRFGRVDAARNWYIWLLDKSDANRLGEEWQHVLHAYLTGAMRNDPELNRLASSYFEKMLRQTEDASADFGKSVSAQAYAFAKHFIYVTEEQYPNLKETCGDYKEMRELLSDMEKMALVAKYFDDVYQAEDDTGENLHEQIENVLYELVNSYDDEEFKVVKNLKYNEAVIAAKGDTGKANAKCKELYGSIGVKKTFGELLTGWALSEDPRQTNIVVKRFAISYLKDRLLKGMEQYFQDRYNTLRQDYKLTISTTPELTPIELECSENTLDTAVDKIQLFYSKHKTQYVFMDKYIKIFLVMCIAALLFIAVAALAVSTQAFPVLLVLGIVLGVVGGFLVWRRWVDRVQELNEKCRLSVLKLRNALDEMASWRKLVQRGYESKEDLKNAVEKF